MNLCYMLDDTTFKSYNGQCFTNTNNLETRDEITNTHNYVCHTKVIIQRNYGSLGSINLYL
jgi:hypothetical protein